MSNAEFRRWAVFYRQWPFDDFHRYHRPAALVSVSMGGSQRVLQDRLDWLQGPTDQEHTSADIDLYRAAGLRA